MSNDRPERVLTGVVLETALVLCVVAGLPLGYK